MADINEFDRMLSETRGLLDQIRGGGTPPGAAEVEGRGEGADGRVRVVAGAGGELTSVELDPRALRMPSEELAEELKEAVNAALRELRSRSQAADTAIDPDVLAERLREAQDQGLRQMAAFTQSLDDLMTRIGARSTGGQPPR
ncbi:YbaB/EbfC family nucleoid-associated protein [Actinomadura chokoriensis]|uniref:YbaB/EbfC family nucleoid-associated protein n=1 Tax=Actinomadura chokoriensis TaxID=454156 RepID=UPI0031F72785